MQRMQTPLYQPTRYLLNKCLRMLQHNLCPKILELRIQQ